MRACVLLALVALLACATSAVHAQVRSVAIPVNQWPHTHVHFLALCPHVAHVCVYFSSLCVVVSPGLCVSGSPTNTSTSCDVVNDGVMTQMWIDGTAFLPATSQTNTHNNTHTHTHTHTHTYLLISTDAQRGLSNAQGCSHKQPLDSLHTAAPRCLAAVQHCATISTLAVSTHAASFVCVLLSVFFACRVVSPAPILHHFRG